MLTQKQIVKEISSIGKMAVKLRDKIHVVACSVVGHALEHGDVTLADRLLVALGNGTRRQALVTWLETFGPFRLTKDKDTGVHVFGLSKSKRQELLESFAPNVYVEMLEQGGPDFPAWDEYTKERITSVYDVVKHLTGIVNTAQAKQKKGEQVKNADLLGQIAVIVAEHNLRELKAKDPVANAAVAEQARAA